ncbi:hypothetical protein AB6A23_05335 [Paenibacillus tarimensis]
MFPSILQYFAGDFKAATIHHPLTEVGRLLVVSDKVYSGPSNGAWYQLREYGPNNADYIITDPNGYSWFYLYPGDTLVYRGISSAVDGSNKKAEFYVYETFSGAARVQYWG